MYKLDDGRMLMASYADIETFFAENSIIGKTIKDVIPFCHDYMIQNIEDVEDFESRRTESAIDTDGKICLLFEDDTNLEVEFCGDGPIVLGVNTAKLREYPKYDGSCYSLRTLFKYCLGYAIVGIHFEKSDHRMTFPTYCGIDMSAEDDGVKEIRFALEGGTTLMASGTIDYFRFEHFMDFGGPVEVRYSELLAELNEETFNAYFENWIKEQSRTEFAEDKLERFSAIDVEYDDIDGIEYGQFGFKDENGEVIIEPQYWCCDDFHHGLCAVAMKGPRYLAPNGCKYYQKLWGYIDKTGKAVIPFKFGRAQNFNQYGVAVVQDEWDDDADFYLIDVHGKEIPGTRFRYIDEYYDYETRYLEFSNVDPEADNNMGLYDTKDRKVIVEPKTGGVIVWSKDCIKVSETGAYGRSDTYIHYINADCEEIYPGLLGKGFSGVNKPNENGHVVIYKRTFYQVDDDVTCWHPIFGKKYRCHQKYGVVDLEGNILIPVIYDGISDMKDGSFECRIEKEKTIIVLKEK